MRRCATRPNSSPSHTRFYISRWISAREVYMPLFILFSGCTTPANSDPATKFRANETNIIVIAQGLCCMELRADTSVCRVLALREGGRALGHSQSRHPVEDLGSEPRLGLLIRQCARAQKPPDQALEAPDRPLSHRAQMIAVLPLPFRASVSCGCSGSPHPSAAEVPCSCRAA